MNKNNKTIKAAAKHDNSELALARDAKAQAGTRYYCNACGTVTYSEGWVVYCRKCGRRL